MFVMRFAGKPADNDHGRIQRIRPAGDLPPPAAGVTGQMDRRRFLATAPIGAPVTVAFGSRDLLLLRHQSRHLDQLPPGTQVDVLPGCGHVPMADHPGAVSALITRSAMPTALAVPSGDRGR